MTALRNFKPITEKKYKNLHFYSTLLKNPKKTANVWDPHLTDKKTGAQRQ